MQKQVEHDMETFRISDSGFEGFMVSGFGGLGLLLPVNKGTEKEWQILQYWGLWRGYDRDPAA